MFRLPIDTRTTPHLGLAYLGAVSEQRGDTVRVFDADVEDQPLADFLHEFQPHMVGITANTPQVKQAWRTAKAIKKELDVPIVFGGPHVSVASEDLDFESLRQPLRGHGGARRGRRPLGRDLRTWWKLPARQPFTAAALMDPDLDLFNDVLGVSYKTSDGQIHRNMDAPRRSPTWIACPGRPTTCSRWTATPTCSRRPMHVDGSRSFQHHDQPRLSLPLHLLLAEHHADQVARPHAGERASTSGGIWCEDLGAQEIGVLDDSANIRKQRLHQLADLLIAKKLNHVPWIFVNGIRANLAD